MKLQEREDEEACSDDCLDNSFEEEGYNYEDDYDEEDDEES